MKALTLPIRLSVELKNQARRVGTAHGVNGDRTNRRSKVAHAAEWATVPERPFRHGLRYLVHPAVTAACAPSLLEIAAALRNETHPIDEEILHEVLTFITDGASPFFGRDRTVALREAVRLQHLVVRGESHRPLGGTPERRRLKRPGSSGARKPVQKKHHFRIAHA